MKKSTIITALTAIMMMAVTPAFAQEENGFKKFNVREDFTENGFQWFHDAELLAAGNKEKSNAMTIGWGGIGTLWGRTALTVYVAEKRYTKEFLDKAEYFTVMAFDVKDSRSAEGRLQGKKVLNYMGTKSGRDADRSATQGDACPDKKAQALGLHTAYTTNGTPYYTEATMVIECKIMYAAPFEPQYFKSDAPKKMYANFPAGIHSMYIGEVVNAWKR
jgi:flavin reductase (DIM6/NTAB) family NADH-FMN oxidoreductase RutF